MMKGFILALCQYLGANTSLGFASGNADLMIGELSLDKEGVYAIIEPTLDPEKEVPILYATIGFWARYRDTSECLEKLDEIFKLLHRLYQYQIGADAHYLVHFSYALGSIEDQKRDFDEYKLMRLSIQFIYQPLDSIS